MNTHIECAECCALYPLGVSAAAGRKFHASNCSRSKVAPRPRRAKFVVQWSFHKSPRATVTIEVDPGRGTVQLVVRPFRRRLVVRADLGTVAQQLVEKHLRLEVIAKRNAKRNRRS